MMKKYNLLEEAWIAVQTDEKGTEKEVSLLDIFKNAHEYKRLSGETETQNFAILRFLLAIMHTVFSRFDFEGNQIEFVKLDDKWIQKEEVEEDDKDDYKKELLKNWKKLWELDKLPEIIVDYLKKWNYKFNLFDDKYPFYQITEKKKEEIFKDGGDKKNVQKEEKTHNIDFKLINRLISESNNKVAMFSPKSDEYKNELQLSSLTRWLITFQGYTGTGDKIKHPDMKKSENTISASKGWLLDIGGVYLAGKNIKETLLLNMTRIDESVKQKPVWEKELSEIVEDLLKPAPNNLAELYTNWSRLLIIKKDENSNKVYGLDSIQMPGISPEEFFLEQMTLWRERKSGKTIEVIPKTHEENQSFWRSFGQLCLGSEAVRIPGIIDWHNHIVEEKYISPGVAKIVSVGLRRMGAPSNTPNGEIYDEINIHDEILVDLAEDGWVPRVINEVEKTKKVIDKVFKRYLDNICEARNIEKSGFVETNIKEAYYNIDIPFREWLFSLRVHDEKEKRIEEWRKVLKENIKAHAYNIFQKSGKRDVLGMVIKSNSGQTSSYKNIFIAYNMFIGNLNKEINNKIIERREYGQ